MTSRFTLLAGVAGFIWAGCSSPAEDGEIADPPAFPPPGIGNPVGQAGAGQQVTPQGGTGGAAGAPVTSAGAGGSAMVAGGAGGALAGAGAGGAASIPTGTGNLIMHDGTGWVPGSSNGVGIQGSFYPFSDADAGGVTTITMGDFASSPTSACASGTASQVQMGLFGTYWGGGIGLNLADAGGGMALGAWPPQTVTGFSFTVTGSAIPAQLRFNAIGADGTTQYCGNLTAGVNTVDMSALRIACYDMTPGEPLATGTQLQAIQWQVVTNETAATQFNFCIENLTALGG